MGAHSHPEYRPEQDRHPQRLESWKEIAAYLHRTVRTVQRWEREEGLPVRRHGHEQRDSVHALAAELDEWLAERSRPVKNGVVPRQAARSKLPVWLASGLAAASLVVGLSAWRYWTASSPALPFAARDRVVIADFENQTGDATLGTGLGLAFAVSLYQSRHANVLPPSRLAPALRRMGRPEDSRIDEATGREICLREGAKGLILPGISRIAAVYVLSARLVDVKSGETVAAYLERAGRQEEILDALGRLAAQVRRGLGESLAAIRRHDEPLPQVTTGSLEALRAYAEGRAAWERGNYESGLQLYTAAVERDPGFAVAHAALGDALLSHVYNRFEEGKAHFERARLLGGRVTERERLAIEARYHAALRNVDNASEAYRAYLAAYPDDAGMRGGFAYFLMRNGRAEEAIHQYQEVIRAAPGDSAALVNLATSFKNLSRPADAIPYYQKAVSLEPRWLTVANINHEYGFALALAGDDGKAREVFSRALAKPEIRAGGLRSLALLEMMEGKYRTAADLLTAAIAAADPHRDPLHPVRSLLFLAILRHGRGDRPGTLAALHRMEASLRKAPGAPNWLRVRAGALFARTGAAGEAARLLEEVTAKADRQSVNDASELRLLEGELALARHDYAGATALLAAAQRESGGPLTLAALARAYDAMGRIDEAAAAYEALLSNLARAAGWEPQQDALEGAARLAEIRLTRNDQAGAAAALDPLAKLWARADPDLPLARRIVRLKAALR